MTENCCFKIEGAFITDLARTWYFDEKKDYAKSEELLISCMMTDDDSEEMEEYKKEIALDIIEGRMMFVGVNALSLVEDNRGGDIRLVQVEELSRKVRHLQKENEELMGMQEKLKEVTEERDSYKNTLDQIGEEMAKIAAKRSPIYRLRVHFGKTNMLDPITLRTRIIGGSEVTDEMNQEMKELCDKYNIYPANKRHGMWEWMSFYDKDTDELMNHTDLIERGFAIVEESPEEPEEELIEDEHPEEASHEEKYGWLSPDGEFIESPWGSHEGKAQEIIEERHWKEDFKNWEKDKDVNAIGMSLARDYLIYRRGWILVDNPNLALGRPRATYDVTKITDKQKVFLYEYFIELGDIMSANMFSDNK